MLLRALMAVLVIVFLVLAAKYVKHPLGQPVQMQADENSKYEVRLINDPDSPLSNYTYYCAYYSLEGKHLVMYAADSTVISDMVISERATCQITKK